MLLLLLLLLLENGKKWINMLKIRNSGGEINKGKWSGHCAKIHANLL